VEHPQGALFPPHLHKHDELELTIDLQHHHTTKHPTAILAILAEEKQEFLEVFTIPLLTSLVVPMTFSEGYITLAYTIVSPSPSLSFRTLVAAPALSSASATSSSPRFRHSPTDDFSLPRAVRRDARPLGRPCALVPPGPVAARGVRRRPRRRGPRPAPPLRQVGQEVRLLSLSLRSCTSSAKLTPIWRSQLRQAVAPLGPRLWHDRRAHRDLGHVSPLAALLSLPSLTLYLALRPLPHLHPPLCRSSTTTPPGLEAAVPPSSPRFVASPRPSS